MIKPRQRNPHRNITISLRQRKELPYVFVFFVLSSILTLVIAWHGTSPISAFFIGEIIIGLFIIDFSRIRILMHVYQVILVYFYFSLVLFHSFNEKSHEFYSIAYLINCLHFFFFVFGYQLIATKTAVMPLPPKQNILSAIYVIFGAISALYILFSVDQVRGYSSQFLSYEEAISQPIFEIYLSLIVGEFVGLIIFLTSHPIFISLVSFTTNMLTYPTSGIKGPLLSSILILIIVAQVYVLKINFRGLLVIGTISCALFFILIGSTSFRGDLSFQSFFDTVTDINILSNRWKYFILKSPESSHIRYTADIVQMIENGMTEIRYGFDYYRFFLYPFKGFLSDWELASYNQYPFLGAGYNISQGLYLGLAGELFWNFGLLFPLFSLAYGVALKRFTNLAFSGSFFGFAVYLISFKVMVWHLYRGEANAVMIWLTALIIGLIIVRIGSRLRQVRMMMAFVSKFSGRAVEQGRRL